MSDVLRSFRPGLPTWSAVALALTLASCAQPTPTGTAPTSPTAQTADAGYDPVYSGKNYTWTDAGTQRAQTIRAQAIGAGDNTLSNENWTSATNGWGPIEKDRSNGEQGATDGRTMTIGGQTFARGFGVHANSQMTFDVGGLCNTFTASVGIDDEVGDRGTVIFQVFADGTKIYDSGVVRGVDGPRAVNVSIAGKRELKLVVTDAGDNNWYDHADWGAAMLRNCVATASPTSPAPVTYSGPLVIRQGGTYRGNWESLDPNVPAVDIQTDQPVIIENANIRGRGDLIRGWWNNLTVRNTRGYGLNPMVSGRHAGRFISVQDVKSLIVENSYMEGTGGIYAATFQGDRSGAAPTIRIVRNKVKNIDGRKSDGAGGYIKDGYRVQFVQLSKIRNVPNVEIAWNEVINEPGKSFLEENINLYSSSGTSGSRFKIHNNFIQGAYAIDPANDTAYSGGGILLGDGDNYNMTVASGFVDVYDNHIVSTSNQGIGVSGGHDQTVWNNRVVSSGRLPDGRVIKTQNVGVYVWDIINGASFGTWYNNVVRNNLIGWTRINADGSTWFNNTWFPHCTVTCYSNTSWSGPVTLDTERQEYQIWQTKATNAGVVTGPR